jgi:capsid portal protein
MREALLISRGLVNLRNLFMYAPNGKRVSLWLIPVSEVTAKEEFFIIKNVTRDDSRAAHRIPTQLTGIVSSNTGGFDATDTAAEVFRRNEIEQLQQRFARPNGRVGEDVVRLNTYSIKTAKTA